MFQSFATTFLCIAAFASSAAFGENEPLGFRTWWASEQEYVWHEPNLCESLIRLRRTGPVEVELARGETEAVQFVLTPNVRKSFDDLSMRFTDLASTSSQAVLPGASLRWRLVRYLNRRWPDILVPVKTFSTHPVQRRNYACWINVTVPNDLPGGTYKGHIEVFSGKKLLMRRELQVKVWDFVLPGPTRFETAIFGIWPRFIPAQFGTELSSPLFYNVCQQMAESLADHRIAHGNVSMSPVADFSVDNMEAALTPRGEEMFLKWCEFWTGRGLNLSCIRFDVWTSGSDLGERFWKHYYPIFKKRGWLRKVWHQHRDEYSTLEEAQATLQQARRVRRAFPDMRIMSTACAGELSVLEAAVGGTNIWATELAIYTNPSYRKFYQQRIAEGEDVFWYIHHHSRFPTDPIALRALHWAAWREGITGSVLFGVNLWSKTPLKHTELGIEQSVTFTGTYEQGYGILFWPGTDGRVHDSVRLEWLRDGIEDWEYLRLAKSKLAELKSKGVGYTELDVQYARIIALSKQIMPLKHAWRQPQGKNWSYEGYGVLAHTLDPQLLLGTRRKLGNLLEQIARKSGVEP